MSVKHENLSEKLKELLIKLEPGDGMLSVREAMRRFNVSQATVISAMAPLLSEGLLEKRKGIGMFVTDEVMKYKPTAPPVIALALPRWTSPEYLNVETSFHELQDTYGFISEVIHYNWHEKIIQTLPSRKIDGLIIISAGESVNPEQIQHLNSFDIPYLILGQNLKELPVNTVYCDEEFGGTMAADYLIKQGHRKLAVLISEPHCAVISDRIRGFSRYCELQGAKQTIIDCGIKSGDDACAKVYSTMKKLLRANNLDFTALFVTSVSPAMPVLKAFYESKLSVPEDVSVISIGDSCYCEYFTPALTTITTGIFNQVEQCIKTMKKILDGSESLPVKVCLKARILKRESTKECKESILV